MSEKNYSIAQDLKEAQAMMDAFVPYVYEDTLYGRLGGRLPVLTPGALLLRIRRMDALRHLFNADQRQDFAELHQKFQAQSTEWRQAFIKKMRYEAEVRLRDIQTYVKECQENFFAASGAYNPEALRRTMVQENFANLPESDVQALKVNTQQADGGLRRYLEQSDFIWDTVLQPLYPKETFWWLYSRPLTTFKDDNN